VAGCGVGAFGLGSLAPDPCLLVAAEGLHAVSRLGAFPQHHVVVGPGRAETMP
jgi:hypothetical protein